jgi:uncharacterized membrane protein
MNPVKYAAFEKRDGHQSAKEVKTMLVMGVLIFAIVTFFISFLIGRMSEFDKGKIATYMTLVAWGSLLYGLYLTKVMP